MTNLAAKLMVQASKHSTSKTRGITEGREIWNKVSGVGVIGGARAPRAPNLTRGADGHVTATLLCFLTTTISNVATILSCTSTPSTATIMTTTQSPRLEAPTSEYFVANGVIGDMRGDALSHNSEGELQYPDSEEVGYMELQYPSSEEFEYLEMTHHGEWPLVAPHLPVNDPGDATVTHPLTITTAAPNDAALTLGEGGLNPTLASSPFMLLDELDGFNFLNQLESAMSSPQYLQSENDGIVMSNHGFTQLSNTTSFAIPHSLYLPPYHTIQPSNDDVQGVDSPIPWLDGSPPQDGLWPETDSPQTSSTRMFPSAALRGNTPEINTTEAAAASDASFIKHQVLELYPLHFDYRQSKGDEDELEEEGEEEDGK